MQDFENNNNNSPTENGSTDYPYGWDTDQRQDTQPSENNGSVCQADRSEQEDDFSLPSFLFDDEQPSADNNTRDDYRSYGRQQPTDTQHTPRADEGYSRPYNANQYPDGQQQRQYTSNGQPPMGGGYPYGSGRYSADDRMNIPKRKNTGLIVLVALLCVAFAIALIGIVSVFSPSSGMSILPGNNASNHGSSVEPATNNDGPAINLAETPQHGGSAAQPTGALTSEDVYLKIRESSVGVMLYSTETRQLASEGSGVIIGEDKNGQYTYIVTCAHVIRASGMTFKVMLFDDSTYNAEIVGYDTRTDIGVLRIKASGLQQAEFANVESLAVGQSVYAIGNPGGSEFAGSFTNGMISAIARPVASSTGYTTKCIQHTAAINPGNSGGALVNAYGQVIGINSMKIVETDYEGMGFAVPSDIVQAIVNDLIVNGYVPDRAKLGITYRPASAYEIYSMVVQIRDLPKGSIVIESISEDSDLANTEAREGDMIIAVNGKDLDDSDYLPLVIENASAGDRLTLSMIRVNADYSLKEFEVTVKLVADMGSAAELDGNE